MLSARSDKCDGTTNMEHIRAVQLWVSLASALLDMASVPLDGELTASADASHAFDRRL